MDKTKTRFWHLQMAPTVIFTRRSKECETVAGRRAPADRTGGFSNAGQQWY